MAAPSQRGGSSRPRSGSTSGARIRVEGLREFRRHLRDLGDLGEGGKSRYWTKELSAANRRIGNLAAEKSRDEAERMGGMQRHFASHIVGSGTVTAARVRLRGRGVPDSAGAFWGAQGRTGWYLNQTLVNRALDPTSVTGVRTQFTLRSGNGTGRPQFPPWVGNSWDAAKAGQGPYAINDALAKNQDEIVSEYGKAIDGLARRAGFTD